MVEYLHTQFETLHKCQAKKKKKKNAWPPPTQTICNDWKHNETHVIINVFILFLSSITPFNWHRTTHLSVNVISIRTRELAFSIQPANWRS